MVTSAKVVLWGLTIGTLHWNERYGTAEFEYAPAIIGKGVEPSPLLMPVKEGRVYSYGNLNPVTFNGLPGMLADSLPDTYGRALFDRGLALTGRTAANPIEALCFLGRRCMGALEFEPAIDSTADDNQRFEIETLVEVASEALIAKSGFGTDLNGDRKAAVAKILRLGTSAGGQRAKALIAYNRQTGEVRSGQIPAPEGFGQCLIKLDGVSAEAGFRETTNFGRLEYSFYKLACQCGIKMSECFLIEEGGRAHFVTERFDRSGTEKVHMQTLCGIAHYDFRALRAYTILWIALQKGAPESWFCFLWMTKKNYLCQREVAVRCRTRWEWPTRAKKLPKCAYEYPYIERKPQGREFHYATDLSVYSATSS